MREKFQVKWRIQATLRFDNGPQIDFSKGEDDVRIAVDALGGRIEPDAAFYEKWVLGDRVEP